MNHIEAMKQALVDEDGENRAVRWFLAAYLNPGMSVGGMKAHLKLSGYPLWPDWVDRCHPSEHLTKAGAQLWIRHLFALEATPPAAQQDIQRLSALVRAQQITIDKLEAAQPAPVQEPVADAMARYLRVCSSGGMPKKLRESVQNLVYDAARLGYFKATTPPAAQRQWVGLTDEEIKHMLELFVIPPHHVEMVVQAIEAKLKAINGFHSTEKDT